LPAPPAPGAPPPPPPTPPFWLQGELLRPGSASLEGIPALASLPAQAAKLLQVTRSTPGVTTALVGHKLREHVEANHKVSQEPRLGPARWMAVHEQVAGALHARA